MRMRKLFWAPLVLALAFLATACPVESGTNGQTTTTTTVNGCLDPSVIPLFGDSNGTQLPQYLPQVANKAQGGSAATEEARATSIARGNPDLPTIVTRVHDYMASCPLPAAVIIQGTTNDWGNEVGSARVIEVVSGLSAYLAGLGVPTFWISMHPVPHNGSWTADQINSMTAYNTWLLTPGNVVGTVINSALPLQDPADPGWLNPAYYFYKAPFVVDPLHVNSAAYSTWASVIFATLNT